MTDEEVVYRIDGQDKLVYMNGAWDRFAAANASPELASDRILSRSLWDFITDKTTRGLYGDLLKGARAGRRVLFPFRCDSPDRKRFLEMQASPLGEGGVEFKVRTLAIEDRPSQPLLDPAGAHSEEFLRVCGWCKKVPVSGKWLEVEEAVAALGLFENPSLPSVSHGICEECEARMRQNLAELIAKDELQ